MIRECEEHGYHRNERCPLCGEEGKFLMSDFEVEKIGRSLAGILRHGKGNPEMDSQGNVAIREVLDLIRARNPRMTWLRARHLEALVDTDPKGRYAMTSSKIRATYGHTIELNIRLDCENIPEELFFPATDEEVDIYLEDGIKPTDRAMVHLSLTYHDALRAGSVRMDDPVVMLIDADECMDAGYDIGKAARTVYLCRYVPPEAVSIAEPSDYEDEASDGPEE